ncbi:MAG: anaerobic ribonucleoside-triphosphate reductase activating protein [Anaerotignum sp.]|nr:anaerobic ribonucleoside-triphosphate reductase activating protein [Anaerotignum sp.]
MKYHNITKDDMLNGEGLRVVLWVSGCPHKCKGCHNPQTWDPESGIPFDEDAEKELFDILSRDYISGITFSGGDPLFEGNRAEIERLAKKVKHEYPDKNIWLYTGYRWEEISALPLVQYVDVLVDGRFMEDLKDTKLHWKGSFNQRIIDVQKSLQNSSLYLYHAE